MALSMDQRLNGRKVVAVACFDSFGKTAMTMLAACRKQGAATELHLLQINNRALSRRQRLEIRRTDRRTPIHKRPWGQFSALASEIADDTDVLILGLDGQRSRDALLQLSSIWEGKAKRPMLVSAYPGLLFRFALEGMLDRSGADLLCLNSQQDLDTYRRGRHAQGLASDNAVVTGLPVLWNAHPSDKPVERPSIVFFEQPSIPVHPLQRRYLCRQLKALAEAWPDHPVIFKPRTSSIESTLHRRHGEMASVIEAMAESVPNLQLSFKPATRLLRSCGCAITVSSTAALEAMAMGVSTRIVGDLGITETLGNHFFAESGAVADFAAIRANPFEAIHDTSWLRQQGWQEQGETLFINAILSRLERGLEPLPTHGTGSKSWGSPSWQTYAISHGGRRMLSSGGSRSSQRKRHKTRTLLRRIRDGVVGFGWLSRWLRER